METKSLVRYWLGVGTLKVAFITLVIILSGCRSVDKLTTTTTVDTTFIIPSIEYKMVEQIKPEVLDTLIFKTPEAVVKVFVIGEDGQDELTYLKSKAISSIEIEPREVNLKATTVTEHIKKENDNPIKNFFFYFGIVAMILIVLVIVLKTMKPI